MSFISDMLFPPWARDIMLGPLGRLLVDEFNSFSGGRHKLFGTGAQPSLPAPPPAPAPPPPTGGTGPTQAEIDKLNNTIKQIQKQLQQLHGAGTDATDQSGANSDNGRRTHDQILQDGSDLGGALAPQGSTPEADSARLAAMQQQIDALTKNVQDKANNANGIADALRNLGMGMPGMGMPGMGMSPLGGLGMPSLGAPGVSPLGVKPPPVTPTDKDPLSPPKVVGDQTPTPAAPAPPATSAPPTAPGAPGGPAHPGSAPPSPPPAPPDSKDITLPSGQVVTAPNPVAAKAVRNAINQPAGKGDVASTAYAGTGVDIPTDGADPGRKIDPSDLQPGDIAVFDDHTAIVAGNGQLIGPDGKLQTLGIINDIPGFKGFYRPTDTADAPAPPPPAHGGNTVLASPPPAAATDTQTVNPGFGLPARSPEHVS